MRLLFYLVVQLNLRLIDSEVNFLGEWCVTLVVCYELLHVFY